MGTPRQEETIYSKLREFTTEAKVRYVLFKVGLSEESDWNVVSSRYLNGLSLEDMDRKYSTSEDVQKAMKLVLRILHDKKMSELYNIYFDRAKEDVQSFRAFTDFSEKYFANDKEDKLISILNGVDFDDED
jgi:hypothetical protein